MKLSSHFLTLFCLSFSIASTPQPSCAQVAAPSLKGQLDQKQSTQAKAALEIIQGWRGKTPQKGERTLKIVYWSPADRKPQPDFQNRLSDILIDIQKYYAREMDRNGFRKLTLQLEKNTEGKIKIYQARGTHPYKHYHEDSGDEILQDVALELAKHKIDAKNETVVIFCNMSNWNPTKRIITQNSPYYARGSSSSGVAWQVDSAILKLADLTNIKERVRDGQYGNITLGKYNTIFIGGIAHELGHALGLPHNLERRDEHQAYGIALMGAGNRAYGNERRMDGLPAFLTQANALRLATHPMFSGVTKQMKQGISYNYNDLKFSVNDKNTAIFKGQITSTVPCYAVVVYVDSEGRSDYNASTIVAIPDKSGNFTLRCPAELFKRKGKLTKGDMRLVSYFANGACTSNNLAVKKHSIPYFFGQGKKLQFGKFVH